MITTEHVMSPTAPHGLQFSVWGKPPNCGSCNPLHGRCGYLFQQNFEAVLTTLNKVGNVPVMSTITDNIAKPNLAHHVSTLWDLAQIRG